MNYKQFLEKLDIYLDYTYMLDEETISKIDNNKKEFVNNLLLAPNITDNSRKDLLEKVIANKISKEDINNILIKLEGVFSNFNDSINDLRVKIREYTKFITKYLKNEHIEKLFRENSKNIDFIFYIVYTKYSELKYKDVIEFINILNKFNIFKKDNIYYNDLLLYKLISLKYADDTFIYLNNPIIMQELCKIAQNLFGFDYIKIYTLIECKLVSKNIEEFREIFNKHMKTMKRWDILQLLDIFELVVYCKDDTIYNLINNLLLSKDIKMLKGNEIDIYNFLLAVKNEDKLKINIYKDKLSKNKAYNFVHYDFFNNQ